MGNLNSAYDLRTFPLHSFTAFIAHWHWTISYSDGYYITEDITAQLYIPPDAAFTLHNEVLLIFNSSRNLPEDNTKRIPPDNALLCLR